MTITVFIPNSNQATLLERAARLRAMADALRHDLNQIPVGVCFTDAQCEASDRVQRYEREAEAFERSAESAS